MQRRSNGHATPVERKGADPPLSGTKAVLATATFDSGGSNAAHGPPAASLAEPTCSAPRLPPVARIGEPPSAPSRRAAEAAQEAPPHCSR
eukprot:CAMPEP_0204551336 /NCGR_PEP_ID=MMETSP0661-20131031/25807_1 /ASSEMBLY_ACC=CAM_ASM_000606 /TAXON_ID=109239 /ORGANISM="Alexandrium margalefi, Strain AMGDE01CS-322" /LENGTH=89 /DNA_ID=CAMNT_0051558331 /DNA_START=36 /DNA_END=303 /DNA_ORIENTATION=+